MRKRIDERLRTLIENGEKASHRSLFIMVGDKSREQIPNLYDLVLKAAGGRKCERNILWCYKDNLELSSNKKKRANQKKKSMQKRLMDPEAADSFSRFVESGFISFCLYKDSERILGSTFKMCILQDFEALTPNLLARTIETVEGGGLIVLLLRSLSSLTSLYTMVMDVHERFRTEAHSEAAGRFNERFLLSVASCKACVVMDDELNILPISSHIKVITPVSITKDSEGFSEAERNLKNLQEQLKDNFPVGPLINNCRTLDQGKAVMTFLDAILDKSLRKTVALLAARGRGKSAALGLAVAGAVATGYSNIFVTAPSPENLKTLFEFIINGLGELDYKEHIDYDVGRSAKPEFKKAVVRINIFKQHRQTIQYINPYEHEKLSQVELLVVDEAAAIPLAVVKSLLGPYLVFLSSTVNGYEGTGRSLSLKLLQQLREQSNMPSKDVESANPASSFTEIKVSESIRYATGDPIESWLHGLLCLDVSNFVPHISRLPPPSDCDLYYVNRDTLFSFHKDSELFLQRMMALFVASHYKNSPNDLHLMADAPAHHLFVLLGPVDESKNQLPDILCVMQVCLEGEISRNSAIKSLSDGRQPSGDQIPWKFCEQFRDTVFPSLSGARIVRIATHPDAMRLGYGSTAVELLRRYFEGQLTPIAEVDVESVVEAPTFRVTEAAEKVSLLEENIKPKTDLPHLLVHLRERRHEKLHYIGVSFGLTLDLFRFWRKLKFAPFYIGQIPNAATGEHTCMVLRPLNINEIEANGSDQWGFFGPFYEEFRQRFLNLLTSTFCRMEYKLAMSVLDPKIDFTKSKPTVPVSSGLLKLLNEILPPRFMERLEAYANNLADFTTIRDFDLDLARQYFRERLPVSLSYAQASVLLCMSVQHKDISYVQEEIKLGREQILQLFLKVMKKFHEHLYGIESKEIESKLPQPKEIVLKPHSISLEEDLNDAAKQAQDEMRSKTDDLLDPELLQQYAIVGKETDFESALRNAGGKIPSGGLVSVKSGKKMEKHGKSKLKSGKRGRNEHNSRSSKKMRP